jgi:hypothetical protein
MTHSRRFRGAVGLLTIIGLVGVLAVAPAQPAAAASAPFTDIGDSMFKGDIEWLYGEGITGGCTATKFCPDAKITREQMASFLVRMFKLPATTKDFFTDDETSIHEGNINKLAAAGITGGCTASTFCPKAPVTRDQMASFIARATKLVAGTGRNYFYDDNGNLHETNIDRSAAAGITSGCAQWRYCPSATVTRGQMAAFLHRIVKPGSPPPYPAPPPPTATPSPKPSCHPSYPGRCIPAPPPDLDCGDIPWTNFTVLAPDPHRFDGDRDGIGCES